VYDIRGATSSLQTHDIRLVIIFENSAFFNWIADHGSIVVRGFHLLPGFNKVTTSQENDACMDVVGIASRI
jgi:hypothetical protein